MSLLIISIFAFLSAVSLIVILFVLPMAVQDSPQARIESRSAEYFENCGLQQSSVDS